MVLRKEYNDRIITVCLCILIFALPFSKSTVEVCFAAAFMLWVLNKILFREPYASPAALFKRIFSGINLPVFLFVLAGFASMCCSVSIPLSAKGFFFKLLEGVFLLFIIADTVNSRKRLDLVLIALLLSMLLMSIDGVFQLITGWDFLRRQDINGGPLYRASFSNPNGFGGWLIVMIPIATAFIITDKSELPPRITKGMLWFLVSIMLLCLVMTYSSGAIVGLVFALTFFAIFRKSKILLAVIACMLALLFIMIPCVVNVYAALDKLVLELTKIGSWNEALSMIWNLMFSIKKGLVPVMLERDTFRTNLWREALLIIKDYPIFGCGLNTYSIVVKHYKSGLQVSGIYPHNSYLQMAAETGIVGLASFMLFVTSLFVVSLVNRARIKGAFYSNALLGLLAGLFGFLVHSFFDVHFYALQLAILMWFIMGLIIAVQRIALKEESKPGEFNAQK